MPVPRSMGHTFLTRFSPAVLVAVALAGPALIGRGGPTASDFDEEAFKTFIRAKPDTVFLGNSMLFTRIDEDYLRELSGNPRISFLHYGGAYSVSWYLWLKNYVLALEKPPKKLVIFFRDNSLTLYLRGANADRMDEVQELMRDSEPEIERILGIGGRNIFASRFSFYSWLYPLSLKRTYFQKRIHYLCQDFGSGLASKKPLQNELEEYFSVQGLRRDLPLPAQFGLGDFGDEVPWNPEEGFLPLIIELASAKGIQVIVYRIKRRPDEAGVRRDSPAMTVYMDRLRPYLEERGVILVDETDDPRLTLDFYRDDDHVEREKMKSYTGLFWARMREHLQ